MPQDIQSSFDNFRAYLSSVIDSKNGHKSVIDELENLITRLGEGETMSAEHLDLLKILFEIQQDCFLEDKLNSKSNSFRESNDALLKRANNLGDLHKRARQFEIEKIHSRETLLQQDQNATKTEVEDDEEAVVETLKEARKTVFQSVAPNMMEESRFFEHGGIGLPQEEIFAIQASIKQIVKQHNLWKMRFFGKIFGTAGNYLICETNRVRNVQCHVGQPQDRSEEAAVPEEPGIGANMWQYWACKKAGEQWQLLPDVTPSQITAATRVRKLLSGNLHNPMNTYPAFPGNEANYLRAQIARITAATMIAPKDLFVEAEEEEGDEDEEDEGPELKLQKLKKKERLPKPKVQLNPEFEEQPLDTFASMENLVHISAHIRKTGRCTRYVLPKPDRGDNDGEDGEEENDDEEEEEEEEEEGDLENNPDHVPLLRELQNDTQLVMPLGDPKKKKERAEDDDEEEEVDDDEEDDDNEEGDDGDLKQEKPPVPNKLQKKQPAWSVRMCNEMNKASRVLILRSHRWPGAFAYIADDGRRYGNVYIGNGCKSTGGMAFTPFLPPMPMVEPQNLVEMIDPSRVNEKRMLQGEEPRDDNDIGGDEDNEEEDEYHE